MDTIATALVIGASRGIGHEFVRQLRGSGTRVIATARDEAGLVENTYTVGFDTGYNFFKLRVDQR